MTKDSLLQCLFFFLCFHQEINIFAELLCCPVSGHNNNNVITIYTCNFDRQVTYKLLLHLQSSLAFDLKDINRSGNLASWNKMTGMCGENYASGWSRLEMRREKMKTETNKKTIFFPIKYFELFICSKYFRAISSHCDTHLLTRST